MMMMMTKPAEAELSGCKDLVLCRNVLMVQAAGRMAAHSRHLHQVPVIATLG